MAGAQQQSGERAGKCATAAGSPQQVDRLAVAGAPPPSPRGERSSSRHSSSAFPAAASSSRALSSGSVHIALTYAARDRPGRDWPSSASAGREARSRYAQHSPFGSLPGRWLVTSLAAGHPETRSGRGLREVHDRYNRGIRQVDGGCQARVARHAQIASTYCQKQRGECPARAISEVDIASCLWLCRFEWATADAVRAVRAGVRRYQLWHGHIADSVGTTEPSWCRLCS